jgi:hypothetical protein
VIAASATLGGASHFRLAGASSSGGSRQVAGSARPLIRGGPFAVITPSVIIRTHRGQPAPARRRSDEETPHRIEAAHAQALAQAAEMHLRVRLGRPGPGAPRRHRRDVGPARAALPLGRDSAARVAFVTVIARRAIMAGTVTGLDGVTALAAAGLGRPRSSVIQGAVISRCAVVGTCQCSSLKITGAL